MIEERAIIFFKSLTVKLKKLANKIDITLKNTTNLKKYTLASYKLKIIIFKKAYVAIFKNIEAKSIDKEVEAST